MSSYDKSVRSVLQYVGGWENREAGHMSYFCQSFLSSVMELICTWYDVCDVITIIGTQ